ncbi:hypothetical protein [Catellatospora chokoriensis]|uniref:Uncharacterized protein n=1 Tax=Catellatospora chokoriensis TaxID=310353 RepID=A0A8J3K4Q8_9ACTN|nr:hypothetical protein [Catellatospora chokoriensis]GIF90660.1 hypothetical protein Cch02nite_41040 [Catellatospora chokoriensis]
MTAKENVWLLVDDDPAGFGVVRADSVTQVVAVADLGDDQHHRVKACAAGRWVWLGRCRSEYREQMIAGLAMTLAAAETSDARYLLIYPVELDVQDGPEANFWWQDDHFMSRFAPPTPRQAR